MVVPENWIAQFVTAAAHEMVVVPVFLMVIENAPRVPAVELPTIDACVIWILDVVDALLPRPMMAAETTAPTPRTAAMMTKRSML